MASMGRAPYHKFYKRDAAEDKRIACNTLLFKGIAGQQFSAFFGDERQQGGQIERPLAQDHTRAGQSDWCTLYIINV